MIQASGSLFQTLGLPKSTGQIYGLLFLSEGPLSLDDMARLLSISKGSASIGTRHLTAWGAIRQVWVPGDRRDHFEAVGDMTQFLRGSYGEFIRPRLAATQRRLATILATLEGDVERGTVSKEDYTFCAERLKTLSRFQKKVQQIGPLAERLLM